MPLINALRKFGTERHLSAAINESTDDLLIPLSFAETTFIDIDLVADN
jgi:hypothetical protein